MVEAAENEIEDASVASRLVSCSECGCPLAFGAAATPVLVCLDCMPRAAARDINPAIWWRLAQAAIVIRKCKTQEAALASAEVLLGQILEALPVQPGKLPEVPPHDLATWALRELAEAVHGALSGEAHGG